VRIHLGAYRIPLGTGLLIPSRKKSLMLRKCYRTATVMESVPLPFF